MFSQHLLTCFFLKKKEFIARLPSPNKIINCNERPFTYQWNRHRHGNIWWKWLNWKNRQQFACECRPEMKIMWLSQWFGRGEETRKGQVKVDWSTNPVAIFLCQPLYLFQQKNRWIVTIKTIIRSLGFHYLPTSCNDPFLLRLYPEVEIGVGITSLTTTHHLLTFYVVVIFSCHLFTLQCAHYSSIWDYCLLFGST